MLKSIRTAAAVVALGLLGSASVASAALIDTQGFENNTAGPIAGQGNWTAVNIPSGSSVQVVSVSGGASTSSVYQGDKALVLTDNVDWGAPIVKYSGEATVKGTISWVAKVSSVQGGGFFLQLGSANDTTGNAVNSIGFNNDGKFLIRPSGTVLDAPEFVLDRWYRFELSFDTEAGTRGTMSVTITDTTNNEQVYSLQDTDLRSNFTKGTPISEVLIRSNNASLGTMYIDNLTVPEPAGGAAMLMGAGALLSMRRR